MPRVRVDPLSMDLNGSDLVREAGRQPAARGEPPRQALGLWHTPDLRGREPQGPGPSRAWLLTGPPTG